MKIFLKVYIKRKYKNCQKNKEYMKSIDFAWKESHLQILFNKMKLNLNKLWEMEKQIIMILILYIPKKNNKKILLLEISMIKNCIISQINLWIFKHLTIIITIKIDKVILRIQCCPKEVKLLPVLLQCLLLHCHKLKTK